VEQASLPEEQRYVWAYHVEIENRSERTVQLVTRYWRITDGAGRVQEVSGEGVVGQQPVLEPGAAFSYTSGCPLSTPSGLMQGNYTLRDQDGNQLIATIPLFALDSPHERRRAN